MNGGTVAERWRAGVNGGTGGGRPRAGIVSQTGGRPCAGIVSRTGGRACAGIVTHTGGRRHRAALAGLVLCSALGAAPALAQPQLQPQSQSQSQTRPQMQSQAQPQMQPQMQPPGSSATATPPSASHAAALPGHCEVPLDAEDTYDFPALRRALERSQPLRLVVLGAFERPAGAAKANGPAARRPALPARLQAALATRLPQASIQLEPFGRRQGAPIEEVRRLIGPKLFAANPMLVVWQIGRGDAIRGVSTYRFGESLRAGIRQLRERGIDLLLIDAQYQPFAELLHSTRDYREYLRWVARTESVPMIQRYEMIEELADRGLIDREATEPDAQNHNIDVIQQCSAYQVARVIALGAAAPGSR